MELFKTLTFWNQIAKYALAIAVGFGLLPGVDVDLVNDPAAAANVDLISRMIAFALSLWATDGIAKRRTALKMEKALKEIPSE